MDLIETYRGYTIKTYYKTVLVYANTEDRYPLDSTSRTVSEAKALVDNYVEGSVR